MGASSSTVTAGIKNQVDGRSNAIYQLADVTGNGVLADIAKESVKSKDPTELDIHIKAVNTIFMEQISLINQF